MYTLRQVAPRNVLLCAVCGVCGLFVGQAIGLGNKQFTVLVLQMIRGKPKIVLLGESTLEE